MIWRLLAGLLFAAAAQAADIGVLPVGLSLGAGHDRAAITVSNRGAEPVTVQVETVSWTQADGRDEYAPTTDLLANPPLFTIPPGKAQVLRVGLRRPPAGEREAAYRIFLREVPPARATRSEDGKAQIRVLLELRLPVYVAPARVVHAQQWRGRRTDDGIAVEVTNTGNVHLAVAGLNLRPADAAPDAPPLASSKASASVFPGQRRGWQLRPETPAAGQRYVLEVTTDRGRQDVALDLGSD